MGEQCNRMVQARRVARATEFLIAAKRVAGRWVAAAAKLGLKHIRVRDSVLHKCERTPHECHCHNFRVHQVSAADGTVSRSAAKDLGLHHSPHSSLALQWAGDGRGFTMGTVPLYTN